MQLPVVLYCGRGRALRHCSFLLLSRGGATPDALDEMALLHSDSLASRCEMSPYITASGTGWTPFFFFCQGVNNISDFVYSLFSPQTLCSRHESSDICRCTNKSQRVARGQITLPEYFQRSLSPCLQVYSRLTMRGDTALCKRHTGSRRVGRVTVCDSISKDNLTGRGGACPLASLQILFGWAN